jgi:cytochrome c oxidase subunit 3
MAATVTTESTEVFEKRAWMGGVEPMKVSYGKLMMWFFLISDTFTFSALLVTYGLIRFSFPAYDPAIHGAFNSQTYTGQFLKRYLMPYLSCMG